MVIGDWWRVAFYSDGFVEQFTSLILIPNSSAMIVNNHLFHLKHFIAKCFRSLIDTKMMPRQSAALSCFASDLSLSIQMEQHKSRLPTVTK
jgi:hypothetical protein